eukprot:5550278-Alexandrium_andersonii.AAC.1
MGRLGLLNAKPTGGTLLAQPLDRRGASTFEMPHGRTLARSENLNASLIVLAQRDNDFPTQDTVPQYRKWDRQGAQGTIKRDHLSLRRAAPRRCLLLRSRQEHKAGVKAHYNDTTARGTPGRAPVTREVSDSEGADAQRIRAAAAPADQS